jgi:DNA-directed RNA polymerase specialized sigma24 family protein
VGDTGDVDSQPDPAASLPLSQACYRLLVRLAALLTGDAQLAETVAAASCSAVLRAAGFRAAALGPDSNDALPRLQREIVARSRRAMRLRHARGHHSYGFDADATAFASLPVVTALCRLPAGPREALVLTYYLDLTEQQAAAMAGVSLIALRRNLAIALHALPADLPGH